VVHRERRRASRSRAWLVLLLSGTRLYLVRHGRASAGWDADPDPPLDEVGRGQAEGLAARLAPTIDGGLPVFTSPLRRCQETAAVLARRWQVDVVVEPLVAEMPSPPGVPMGRRVAWIREAMAGTWNDLGPSYVAYRDAAIQWLTAAPVSAVIVSHFFAINAAIGAATDDDRTLIRSLDNCSVTIFDVDGGRLSLVEGGHEANTLIR
jgi:broad specificity phosphatase PhoE